jgi:hypothetical protein
MGNLYSPPKSWWRPDEWCGAICQLRDVYEAASIPVRGRSAPIRSRLADTCATAGPAANQTGLGPARRHAVIALRQIEVA